jgi:hypothetical protein
VDDWDKSASLNVGATPRRSTSSLGATVPSSLSLLAARHLVSFGIAFHNDVDGDVRVPALCKDVGDLVLSFVDGEISIFIGNITHRHFTPFAAHGKLAAYTNEDCARDAIQFVRDLLNDKWVIWKLSTGTGGCYMPGGDDESSADAPLPGEAPSLFVWSRAIAGA